MSKQKPRLRSSKDVYHRLKWGGGFPSHRILIGYMDRIEGMKEMAYPRFRPGGRIPWNRVWYFKLDKKILWDREKRIDLVFGSGESSPADKLKYAPPKGGGFPAEFERRPVWAWDQEERKWIPANGPTAGAEPIRRDQLRLLTYNVLRTDDHRPGLQHMKRIPALLRLIESTEADIILLQEVQLDIWKMLLRQPWLREQYFLSCGPELNPEKSMEEVILSKWPPQRVQALTFSKEKEAIGMVFQVNGHPLSIYNLHLPSDQSRGAEDKRYRYVKELSHALPEKETVLIGGDLNTEEELPFPGGFKDLWPILQIDHAKGNYDEEDGMTFEPSYNRLAELTSGQTDHGPVDQYGLLETDGPGPHDRRLDRIFLSNPHRHLLPQSMERIGEGERDKDDEWVIPSDHYGLVTEFSLGVTFQKLLGVESGLQTAVVYIPPPSSWSQIQAIRSRYHSSLGYPFPHIKLLPAFLPERYFPNAAPIIRQAMSEVPFFQMELNTIAHAEMPRNQLLWLEPDPEAQTRLLDIQTRLLELFPNCLVPAAEESHTMRMVIAWIYGRNAGRASRLREEWQKSWEGLTVDVGALALISTRSHQDFEVREVIPLGDESEWESFAPGGWTLETSLGSLGLLPGWHHAAAAERVEQQLFQMVRTLDRKAQLYSVGSLGMDLLGTESDLDFLCIGRMEPDAFFRQMADELGGWDGFYYLDHGVVRVLKGEYEGHQVDLMYVRYPDEVAIGRPSHLPVASYRHFDLVSQRTLSVSLEVAALRRFIGADHSAFRVALLALRAWARARQLDDEAFGFPNGLAWALVLAATPAEEAPELWLERCFEFLVGHDWRTPIMPIEGFYPEDRSAVMQVVTASSPAWNVTANVTASNLKVLLTAFEEGLTTIWDIKENGGVWSDFLSPTGEEPPHQLRSEEFSARRERRLLAYAQEMKPETPVNPPSDATLLKDRIPPQNGQRSQIEINVQGMDRKGYELALQWVRQHIRELILSLESSAKEIRPWSTFRSFEIFGGWYVLHIGEVTDQALLESTLKYFVTSFRSWEHRPKGTRCWTVQLNEAEMELLEG